MTLPDFDAEELDGLELIMTIADCLHVLSDRFT